MKKNHAMLSPQTLDDYRRMTLSERLALALEMMRAETRYLLAGPTEAVDRRFERLRSENDLRNRAMLEGLAKATKR
jgi:hypothetical protein